MSVAAAIVRITDAGDSALRVELEDRIDPRVNAAAVALAEGIREGCGASIRDAVIGYSTVTIYFDPLAVEAGWLEREVRAAADRVEPGEAAANRMIEVPVCYGGEFGPDLEEVAAFGRCSTEEVIRLHAGTEYRVYMVGFVPGFAYMGIVDPRIAAPRRAAPRAAVPAGAVGIAGGQTGIYPLSTPGGWNIIGRTALKPYDPTRPQPFLFRAGDRVRFTPVSVDRLAHAG